jgi:hypothetical protein
MRPEDINHKFYDISEIDLPPADPICFTMAKLGNPELTYHEFVLEWQKNTRRLKAEQRKLNE